MVKAANNPKVAAHLLDGFPSPYHLDHARARLADVARLPVLEALVIEVRGEFAGGLSCTRKRDVFRLTGSIGYWLGESFWGQNIMSEAVEVFSDYLLAHEGFTRVEAGIFDFNHASARVLEKAGFQMEAVCRRAAVKQGRVVDIHLYSKVVT